MGSGREKAKAVAARRAFGSGYRVVPSMGIFGLKMRFLDHVSIWCVGLGGLGFAVKICGEFGDSGEVWEEGEPGLSFGGSGLRPGKLLETGGDPRVVLGEVELGWVGNVLRAREMVDWACGEMLDWA